MPVILIPVSAFAQILIASMVAGAGTGAALKKGDKPEVFEHLRKAFQEAGAAEFSLEKE